MKEELKMSTCKMKSSIKRPIYSQKEEAGSKAGTC